MIPGRWALRTAMVALATAVVACQPSSSASPTPAPSEPSAPSATPAASASAEVEHTLFAAGDIAACDSEGDEATAALLDSLVHTAELDPTILALGDLAYDAGTAQQFASCYGPSWGRHGERTRPAAGNHEYETAGAAAYFEYFGEAAGTPGEGWYAWNLGEWRLIALNSNCDHVGGCGLGSPQMAWLTDELATNRADCSLAYWHHPRWSSGVEHGSIEAVDPFWRALHAAGVDLVLAGHEHTYERFVPMDLGGAADPEGMVAFIVGTGGRSLYGFADILPTSAVRDNSTFGVLQLTLREGAYDWAFVPTTEGGFTDAGTASCR